MDSLRWRHLIIHEHFVSNQNFDGHDLFDRVVIFTLWSFRILLYIDNSFRLFHYKLKKNILCLSCIICLNFVEILDEHFLNDFIDPQSYRLRYFLILSYRWFHWDVEIKEWICFCIIEFGIDFHMFRILWSSCFNDIRCQFLWSIDVHQIWSRDIV